MTQARLETGRAAERLCAARVRERGWTVIERNWRIKAGEIDLIARDGPILIVIEVKAIHAGIRLGPIAPALAVGPRKQQRIRRLASAWLAGPGRHLRFRDMRFDVVGVEFDRAGRVASYEHIENAF